MTKSLMHGGKRNGSGRKKKNKIPFFTRVKAETISTIDALKSNSHSRGDFLDLTFSHPKNQKLLDRSSKE